MSRSPQLDAHGGDPYRVLGIGPSACHREIKAAYRRLVKEHHPDAGGDEELILALNAAWELLGDAERRRAFDRDRRIASADDGQEEARRRGARNARAAQAASRSTGRGICADDALVQWLQSVYGPVDRQLGQVINAFPAQLRALSADPYDDALMEAFCAYLERSRDRIDKVKTLYQSLPTPASARGFGLSLYHCLSQVEDALNELDRYTMGYVDNYLHDGREMLREAKRRRQRLHEERGRLEIG